MPWSPLVIWNFRGAQLEGGSNRGRGRNRGNTVFRFMDIIITKFHEESNAKNRSSFNKQGKKISPKN